MIDANLPRHPSLKALRAFEAAGRHLSIGDAAQELSVSPSAISHQIRHLEEFYDSTLFARDGRRLVLTSTGQTLLSGLTNVFTSLNQVLSAFESTQRQQVLTVSMLSTFALRWFIPHLPSPPTYTGD